MPEHLKFDKSQRYHPLADTGPVSQTQRHIELNGHPRTQPSISFRSRVYYRCSIRFTGGSAVG